MKNNIALYFLFAKQTIRSEMSHRASFITGVIGQWLSYGATFATLYFMISNFGNLGGWSADEVLFLYAFNLLSYALAACIFFTPCANLSSKIRTGEFDSALTKPMTPFMHEIYNGFNFGYIGHTILSVFIIAISISKTSLTLTPINILMFLLMLISSALIQAALLIFSSSISFVTVNANPAGTIVYNLKKFIDYPITIYGAGIQILLTVLLPVAFINFYPVCALLNSPASIFPDFTAFLTPLVAIFLFCLSIKTWNLGLSKYQSSGS